MTNSRGNVIAGASVSRLIGTGMGSRDGSLRTRQVSVGQTDEHGRIQLESDPAERSAFLVRAVGKSPQTFGFWGCVPPAYRVTMEDESKALSGRVTDSAGKPAANITVHLRFGDRYCLIPVQQYQGLTITFDVDTKTDDHGHFTLAQSPAYGGYDLSTDVDGHRHPILSDVAPGEQGTLDTADLRAGTFAGHISADQISAERVPPPTTQPTMTILLRVLDSETNLPIKYVTVSPGGAVSEDQFLYTFDSNAIELPGDHINWSFYDGAWSYFLRVSADGYASGPTRVIKASEKNVTLELKLSKAQPATLQVLNPDGKPAAGALVYLATPTVPVRVPLTAAMPDCNKSLATVEANGVLHFTPPSEAYRLAICCEGGFAEVDGTVDKTKPITLTAWASAMISAGTPGKPIVGLRLQPQTGYSVNSLCPINWTGSYTSDQTGCVTLARCKPGSFFSFVSLPGTLTDRGYSRFEIEYDFKPGEHASWALMTGTTTVKGLIKDPPGYELLMITVKPCGPAAELPVGINQLTEHRRAWAVGEATSAAPDQNAIERRMSCLYIDHRDHGSFAITGLRPGTYKIEGYPSPLQTGDDKKPATAPSAPPVLAWYFTVPPTQPKAIDLGNISAQSDVVSMQPGQVVPDLAMQSLDDKPFDLKGNRGHWVLLDFWGTWCPSCVDETPTLKEVYQGWGQDGRLTMASVSVNDTPEQVRKFANKNQTLWTQLVLGPGGQTDIPDRFGVPWFPTIMLISPEGKLVETDLRGSHLKAVLGKYLGKPISGKPATTHESKHE